MNQCVGCGSFFEDDGIVVNGADRSPCLRTRVCSGRCQQKVKYIFEEKKLVSNLPIYAMEMPKIGAKIYSE